MIKIITEETQNQLIKVKGATMLSLKEFLALKKNIPLLPREWWLRTSSDYHAWVVDEEGYAQQSWYVGQGAASSPSESGVRQFYYKDESHYYRIALEIFDIAGHKVGDKFRAGGEIFTIISNGLAISDKFAGKSYFDSEDNDYENSNIKNLIDNWYKQALNKHNPKDNCIFLSGVEDEQKKNEPLTQKIGIKGATLLSKEEYEKYMLNIPDLFRSWWLRTPVTRTREMCYVNCENNVYYVDGYGKTHGKSPDCDYIWLRPVLILDEQSSNFNVGDEFKFDGDLYTIISSNLAICNKGRYKCKFSDEYFKGANIYDNSDIKKYIQWWFEDAIKVYNRQK